VDGPKVDNFNSLDWGILFLDFEGGVRGFAEGARGAGS